MKILLEIGMEEIPARFLKPALNDIEKYIKKEFESQRVNFETLKTFGTPRRLVLLVDGVSERQEDLDIVNTGPAKEVAYDVNGELTRAGVGFAKSQGIDPTDLEILETPKGEYIAVRKFVEGKDTKELLPEFLKNLITGLTFQKSMKWSDLNMRFARPVQWFLAMADDELIEFEIEGIKSALKSKGHRFFGEDFEVSSIEEYFTKLKENNVIVDIEERKQMILDMIQEKCTKTGEQVLIEPDLLDEVTNLIEYPYPIVGTFNSEFLEVPQEVLIISMQVHQRYFPILDDKGKLLPKFVVIRNGITSSEHVRKGNEKVLSARLSDARFFYQEDQKKSLEEFVEKLSTVVFQKDLGTIAQKISRSKKLAEYMTGKLALNDSKEDIMRTIHLAKADLVSNMIGEKEFTKLQGFMGADYALKAGEKETVSKGIEEHYYPRYQGDKLPQGIEGVIAGICDRMDTLVGCFGIGMTPSGSKDPFALRRASLAIVNIILNSKLVISLEELISKMLDILEEDNVLKKPKKDVLNELMEFFRQRAINVFVDKGHRKDVISAVLSIDCDVLLEASEKIETLEKVSKEEGFNDLVLLLKRVGNISKDHLEKTISTDLLVEDAEKELHKFYVDLDSKTELNLQTKSYEEFFRNILAGKDVINRFFDRVMVMDKDQSLKNNRLSLLKSLNEIFNRVAKLNLIEEK
ncbi:glycine--tRNA ligase subunit beta [uncultured Ilyobacter sp.]|uniref:glycine--tRNA ligase subunit beta n=1 Tax=uncultured Ilyobacter sp. TaxID=544433 RepID=UPI0029F5BC14|nr:glycine--tRNA ligase subunit beta [uncultured Ilyobacter sp.]